jgi:hypothetical protein
MGIYSSHINNRNPLPSWTLKILPSRKARSNRSWRALRTNILVLGSSFLDVRDNSFGSKIPGGTLESHPARPGRGNENGVPGAGPDLIATWKEFLSYCNRLSLQLRDFDLFDARGGRIGKRRCWVSYSGSKHSGRRRSKAGLG